MSIWLRGVKTIVWPKKYKKKIERGFVTEETWLLISRKFSHCKNLHRMNCRLRELDNNTFLGKKGCGKRFYGILGNAWFTDGWWGTIWSQRFQVLHSSGFRSIINYPLPILRYEQSYFELPILSQAYTQRSPTQHPNAKTQTRKAMIWSFGRQVERNRKFGFNWTFGNGTVSFLVLFEGLWRGLRE